MNCRIALVALLACASCTSIHNAFTSPGEVWIDETAAASPSPRPDYRFATVARTPGGEDIGGGVPQTDGSVVLYRERGFVDTPSINLATGASGGDAEWGTYARTDETTTVDGHVWRRYLAK